MEKYCWFLAHEDVSLLFRGNFLMVELELMVCTTKPMRYLARTYVFPRGLVPIALRNCTSSKIL